MHFTRQPLIYQLFSTIFSQLLFHRPIVQTRYKMGFQPGAQKSVNVGILEKHTYSTSSHAHSLKLKTS